MGGHGGNGDSRILRKEGGRVEGEHLYNALGRTEAGRFLSILFVITVQDKTEFRVFDAYVLDISTLASETQKYGSVLSLRRIQPPFYLKGGRGDLTSVLRIPLDPPFKRQRGRVRGLSPGKSFMKMLYKQRSILDKSETGCAFELILLEVRQWKR